MTGAPEDAARGRLLRLAVSYAGTAYAGWQFQPGAPTVQGTLEEVLSRLLDEQVRVVGAARTDAGVHARGQVATVRTSSALPVDRLRRGANALLPGDIRLFAVSEAPPEFRVLADVRRKEYRYRIWNDELVPPWERPFAAHVERPLDAGRFRDAAARLLGIHDMTAFSCAGSSEVRPVRTVSRSELTIAGPLWVYTVEADGFLYKMVRRIAGTLIEIASGREDPALIGTLLESRSRTMGRAVAPAEGLFLERVIYDGDQ